jgi:hypothetical protein
MDEHRPKSKKIQTYSARSIDHQPGPPLQRSIEIISSQSARLFFAPDNYNANSLSYCTALSEMIMNLFRYSLFRLLPR